MHERTQIILNIADRCALEAVVANRNSPHEADDGEPSTVRHNLTLMRFD
jgi:hypothetical protein